jgi:hypothetical protein
VSVEQPYSVWADWLSKFHTWPEGVQALWVVGLTVTALGVIAGATRVLVAVIAIFHRPPPLVLPEAAWVAKGAGPPERFLSSAMPEARAPHLTRRTMLPE